MNAGTARWLGGLALLCFAMLGDVLLPGAAVLGHAAGDMPMHTLPWRAFGFGELARGNLPLWNPYVFGGAPYFGGVQSALLYPPNLLFLVLPLPLALNWSVALNLWLAGAFMFLWAARRGLAPGAAFVSAALFMFSAPHFLRLQAGLVTNLAAIAWAPLIFLCIDEWLASRRPRWCLLGMAAVALQILAGQPQFVYYTAIVAAIYAGLRLLEPREGRAAAAAGLLAVYAGGALLAAVQLLAALQATAETLRAEALPYRFAAAFSFPPENLVTLLAPGFFGDIWRQPYWGRWYLWEACAFFGVSGFALAVHGFFIVKMPGRRALLVAAAVAVLLALGGYTPLHRLLYDWLPWFDKFRAAGKFMFLAVMLLALLAGCGLDRVLRERTVSPRAAWVAAGGALLLLILAALVRRLDWSGAIAAMGNTGESYADPGAWGAAALQSFAALGLAIAGATLALAAGLLRWARREPRAAAWLLGALAVAEVFVFARMQRPTFDAAAVAYPELRRILASRPGDYRLLNLVYPNSGVFTGARDAWGYDPAVERRYAELVHWIAGGDPALATQMLTIERMHPLLALLRVRYVVDFGGGKMTLSPAPAPPLARLQLIGAHRVRAGREAALGALGEPGFDPRREVVLEREPRPAPVAAASQGRVNVRRESTDWLEIEAEVTSPSVLLVTDAWSPAWRARGVGASAASEYEVIPANYALMGVALGAGRHHLRLEYAPPAFRAGIAVSALACLAWLGAALLLYRRERMRRA